MKCITTGLGLAVALGLTGMASTALGQDWTDDFESYYDGQLLDNVGGWRGWDNASGVVGNCSNAQAHSGTKSIFTEVTDDAIHPVAFNTGTGTIRAWVYTPSATFSANHHFIVNNVYNDGGPYEWVVQLSFDKTGGFGGGANTVADALRTETNFPPIAFDQWVEIRCDVDIAADTITTFYNNVEVSTGALFIRGNLHEIQNVDLFTEGAKAYYDDVSITGLTNVQPCPSDFVATQIGSCPGSNRISWSGAPADSTVRIIYTTNGGGGGVIPPNSPCPGTTVCIGLAGVTLHPQVLHSASNGSGLTPTFSAPCGLNLQMITQTSCQTSNAITL